MRCGLPAPQRLSLRASNVTRKVGRLKLAFVRKDIPKVRRGDEGGEGGGRGGGGGGGDIVAELASSDSFDSWQGSMESERADSLRGLVTQPSGISRHAIRPASSGGLLTRRGQFRARASIRNPPWAGRARTPDRERISTATRARSVTESRLATLHARARTFLLFLQREYIYIYRWRKILCIIFIDPLATRKRERIVYGIGKRENRSFIIRGSCKGAHPE